jgi:hypothetical protein
VFIPDQKNYPWALSQNSSMQKIGLISFLISLWIVIFYFDSGWVMTLILIFPMTALVGMGVAIALEWVIEPLVRWINK